MLFARIARSLLAPVTLLYRVVSRFDGRRRMRRAYRSTLPVISVGNISVGGSGKTPLVELLVERLQRERPIAVLSRGFGRSDSEPRIWRAGGSLPDATTFGDEPALLARSLHNGVIAVGADRSALARSLEAELSDGVIVLDDGFQHRQLARDVDIVVLDDATATPPLRLIPAGRLRELPDALGRADLVVAMSERAAALARAFLPGDRIFDARIIPTGVSRRADGSTLEPGAVVVLVTGIARPGRVARTVLELDLNLAQHLKYRDHKRYTPGDVAAILRVLEKHPAATLVTTRKDAVKLERFPDLVERLHVIDIALRIDEEERFLSVVRDLCARARHR